MGPAEGDSYKSADDDKSRRKERPGARQTNHGTTTASCYRASSTLSASGPFRETLRAYGAASEGRAPAQVLSAALTGQAGETCPGRGSETSQSLQGFARFRAYFRAYKRKPGISRLGGRKRQPRIGKNDSLLWACEQLSEARRPMHVRYLR